MTLKDAYREKFAVQLKEHRARLELLKGKLKELGDTSGDAWQDLKGGVEQAWADVSKSCKKAAHRFNNES